ncbi:hypothetical protein BV20DRAFT_322975 [Pilatotrama ljubarskyi]|nr:hypothetical protein BV20DRAFT_322975 [Pilatotrama ljubarskyi]
MGRPRQSRSPCLHTSLTAQPRLYRIRRLGANIYILYDSRQAYREEQICVRLAAPERDTRRTASGTLIITSLAIVPRIHVCEETSSPSTGPLTFQPRSALGAHACLVGYASAATTLARVQ